MPGERGTATETVAEIAVRRPSYWHLRLVAVALSAGMFAGVLASSHLSQNFRLGPLARASHASGAGHHEFVIERVPSRWRGTGT
jgi:hypothetical protein